MNDGSEKRGTFVEVLLTFTRLGLTSFGGPVAHLGYFRADIVERRRWVDEQTYGDLVALCQFLPGPASSQVAMALGIRRAGLWGALAAWLGFTLPSAIALILFALGLNALSPDSTRGWLHGLNIVAVAVVAQAVWSLARTLAPDRIRATFAIVAAIVTLAVSNPFIQVAIIVVAGLVGWRILLRTAPKEAAPFEVAFSRRIALGCLAIFFVLLAALPVARQLSSDQSVAVFDSFYRSGALVFGGGHVVLPLLQAEVVPPGWVTPDQFNAGYGAAQAVPGPLFTFSAYLGAISRPQPNGWIGGVLALVAIFLPSALLVIGALPFWNTLRNRADFRAALTGVNAAVVGLLGAAFYTPVFTSAIRTSTDFMLGLAAFGLLMFWKWPPWVVVVLTAAGGAALQIASV